ncbi:bacillithiol biosynthesis BshC, partial [Candidatus Bipolaricaulota bacterium]|nr:bacillithiol biosynthesis BshC [Candidatus Bipolaricaulota bacterium]
MLELLPIDKLYPDRPFFRDFVACRDEATRFLENASRSDPLVPERLAQVQIDDDLRNALRQSNLERGADGATLANIDALASPTTLCVQTGQQPGLLGGPLFTAYKIISAIRAARRLAERLAVPVVPVYWMASHDHDLNEVNHVHWLGADNEVATARFRWQEEGRRLDALRITGEAIEIVTRYFDQISGADTSRDRVRLLFAPAETDNFCSWHARIWLRLFSAHGLVIADPCWLPPPVSFYRTALREAQEISGRTSTQCRRLQAAGYPTPFPSDAAGGLFVQDSNDRRVRVVSPDHAVSDLAHRPSVFSPDAALRPILADWWFPTAVNILGPGEITYHAALRTLYPLFGLRQPPAAF